MVMRSLTLVCIRLQLVCAFRVQQSRLGVGVREPLPVAFQGAMRFRQTQQQVHSHGRTSHGTAMEEAAEMHPHQHPSKQEFIVPKDYNYSRSTEDNYAVGQTGDASLVGEFIEFRRSLDHAYHRVYQKERQLLQDCIVKKKLDAVVLGSHFDVTCEAPDNKWIVFTAGGMGAGKTSTLSWLSKQTYFPLDAFVYVDPDEIRSMFPESKRYLETDGSTYGDLTQKEAGYIAELMIETALGQEKPVLVDGSLREHKWYLKYFGILRRSQPDLKIGIIHVNASVECQYERMTKRARQTGRMIPEQLMEKTSHAIRESLSVLVPHSDFFASIDNEGEIPRLSSMIRGANGANAAERENMTWDEFRDIWAGN